jgi:protein-disulfide isomerase
MDENPFDDNKTIIARSSEIENILAEPPAVESAEGEPSAPQVIELPASETPKKKGWLWWVAGGCVVLAACFCIIPVCVIAVLTLLGPTIGNTFSGITSTLEAPLPDNSQGSVPMDVNAIGDPNAKVVIIEFSDYQCPYCKDFAENTGKLLIKDYAETGQIYFVYRSMGNFISDWAGGSNTESQDAAQASYCAGDQGKFWEYHDTLFANWNGENQGNLSTDRLVSFAQDIGLNKNEFSDCLSSQKYLERVMQDATDGNTYGVQGTPSFVINGKLVEGSLPYADFEKMIQDELAK